MFLSGFIIIEINTKLLLFSFPSFLSSTVQNHYLYLIGKPKDWLCGKRSAFLWYLFSWYRKQQGLGCLLSAEILLVGTIMKKKLYHFSNTEVAKGLEIQSSREQPRCCPPFVVLAALINFYLHGMEEQKLSHAG